MIAVLFAWPKGVYAGRNDVDLWDKDRDARLYHGPWSIVGHPPCDRWCQFAHIHKHKPGKAIGDDGGCFKSCLSSVRTFGGVIEHPANSLAWPHFSLPQPVTGGAGCARCSTPGGRAR
jgi:hypothetical protein